MSRNDKAWVTLSVVLGYLLWKTYDLSKDVDLLIKYAGYKIQEEEQEEYDQQFEEIIDETGLGDEFP